MQKIKNKPGNNIALIGVVAVGVLLIAMAAFFAFGAGQGGGTPKLVTEPRQIDFGEVKLGSEKTFSFTVTNAGDGALRFSETPYIEVMEGC